MENKISNLINNGVYPKVIKVTQDEAKSIVSSFYTHWSTFDYDKYVSGVSGVDGYFTAYYNTRNGKQKKCVVLFGRIREY